tara:strand:- start:2335 stop:2514 length:180 start_codon:yes stop_codon:yes gene_type:complete
MNPTLRKIIIRSVFWVVYTYILYIAIMDNWWIWIALISPALFYIFYYEDLPKSIKIKIK